MGKSSHVERTAVLPDDTKTIDGLIANLVKEGVFEVDGVADVRIFLRKNGAHKLTTKGRLWELAGGTLNLRFPSTKMDKVERDDGALVLDLVVNEKDFVI